MVNLKTNKFISGWLLSPEQIEYIKLTENFLNQRIDVDEFQTKFYEMRYSDFEKDYNW